MAMFPEQITDHLWKYLTVRQWPIRRCQTGIITGHERAGND
jgi:hypothetical protein